MNRLNARQRHVLGLACGGLRNAEIARIMGLKERTVKSYMTQLFLIFDVTNRTELVALACEALRGQASAPLPEGGKSERA